MTLALFDLDKTLLTGDSDELWCEYLMRHGLLERASFERRNAEMVRDYADGSVTVQAFSEFYVSTLAGLTTVEVEAWAQRFLDEVIAPRISGAAHALVQAHRERGETLVLTTATNRAITQMTARHLGIEHLLATEAEVVDGAYTGRTVGMLNMREGKVTRLREWLAEQGITPSSIQAALQGATFYSDSANDLPLLGSVGRPVAVDPDARLRAHALARGWEIVELPR